jgi:hypothetical protein
MEHKEKEDVSEEVFENDNLSFSMISMHRDYT